MRGRVRLAVEPVGCFVALRRIASRSQESGNALRPCPVRVATCVNQTPSEPLLTWCWRDGADTCKSKCPSCLAPSASTSQLPTCAPTSRRLRCDKLPSLSIHCHITHPWLAQPSSLPLSSAFIYLHLPFTPPLLSLHFHLHLAFTSPLFHLHLAFTCPMPLFRDTLSLVSPSTLSPFTCLHSLPSPFRHSPSSVFPPLLTLPGACCSTRLYADKPSVHRYSCGTARRRWSRASPTCWSSRARWSSTRHSRSGRRAPISRCAADCAMA